MGLPAALAQISPALVKAGVSLGENFGSLAEPAQGLPFGIPELDDALPDHGLSKGGVVELSVPGGGGLGTSLALAAVRAFQIEARSSFSADAVPWCAFVDPSATLYAPGVLATGVDLSRLLVVRPEPEAVGRVALKLTESGVFSLVVVDTVGALGGTALSPRNLGRIVRRLSLAVDGTARSVILLTDAKEQRSLPLPVAQRLLLARPSAERLVVRVVKDRRGRISPPRSLHWTRGAPPVRNAEEGGVHARKLA